MEVTKDNNIDENDCIITASINNSSIDNHNDYISEIYQTKDFRQERQLLLDRSV
jgi:hypothetical protein